jgi:hypothetical protein
MLWPSGNSTISGGAADGRHWRATTGARSFRLNGSRRLSWRGSDDYVTLKMALHHLLGLKPWNANVLDVEIVEDSDDAPESDGTAWAASWPMVVALRKQLMAANCVPVGEMLRAERAGPGAK